LKGLVTEMQISIKTDFGGIQSQLKQLSIDLQRKVIPAALNKTIAKAQTTMIKEISSEFNIKQSEVRSNIRIQKANKRTANWYAVIDPYALGNRGRGLNVIRFMEKKVALSEAKRRVKSGTLSELRFQFKKGRSGKIIKGAFIGNNGRTVFERVPGEYMRSRKGNTKHSQAIKPVSMINVAQMFNTRRINAAVINRINREIGIEFERAIAAAKSGVLR
jgi:hypothetical protein